MRLVVSEKPSVARAISSVLGGKKSKTVIWKGRIISYPGAWAIW